MDPILVSRMRFVQDFAELEHVAEQPKLRVCSHCGQLGMVNAHGFLRGYSLDGTPEVVRGRRFFCSNRGRKRGCGKTMSVLFQVLITTFSVTTSLLFNLAKRVLGGASVRAAWLIVCDGRFSERSGYRLWSRLLGCLPHVRTQLIKAGPPPTCEDTHPLRQLLLHIEEHVHCGEDSFAAFQYRFQAGLFR